MNARGWPPVFSAYLCWLLIHAKCVCVAFLSFGVLDASCFAGMFASNFTAQADAYEALFTAVSNASGIVSGVFTFWIDNPSTSDYVSVGSKWPCFYTPRGKPAFSVLAAAYGAPGIHVT